MGGIDRGRCRVLAAIVLATAVAATVVHAADPAAVVIVFDGSGSMWGPIEGPKGSKLVLARDAVRRGLAKTNPQTRVGLASFSQRRGDCTDVEMLRPPEPLDVQRLMEPLEKLNPRGRGPITLAVREAAKSLGAGPARRSVILIHDDADNCQLNVCAVAEELKVAGIAAHVVGLGLKTDDAAKMACLPQLTGGRMFNAQSAAEIGTAIEEALRLASTATAVVGQPSPKPPPAPSGPALAPIPADAPPGLHLRALLASNMEVLNQPLSWTVLVEGQGGAVVFAGRAANPHVPVAPGRYVVEAREGAVVASQVVEVAAQRATPVNLVLNAGLLRVRGLVERVGAPLGDAIITVAEAGPGSESRKDATAGPPVAVHKGGEALVLLPAGRYLVRVEQGLVRTERSVVVPAGSQGRVDVPLNAARLQVSAVGRDGAAAPDAPVFSVDEDDPDAPRGRREVARAAGSQADFVLAPGTYYVIARQGNAEVRERLALGPGDVVKRTLALATGRLALAINAPGLASAAEQVTYRVERLDASPPEVITTSRPAPMLVLAPGRYRVEGRFGAMNARVVRDVEVRAGQAQQLTLEPQASAVRLRLVGNSVSAQMDIFWNVRDEAGRTVWTTGQHEPAATLQAGRYQVSAATRDKRYERAIELRPGESRLVELTAD
jgi:Ca-activated chloride channel family protein